MADKPEIPKIKQGAVGGGKIEITVSGGGMQIRSNDPKVVIIRKD
jgi:hypothetical protein